MPMYATGYIFSKKFFTGWVVVGIIWIFLSFGAVGIYPLWESRATLARVTKAMFLGKKPSPVMVVAEREMKGQPSGTTTPEKKVESE